MRGGPDGVPPLSPRDQWSAERVEAVLDLYPFSPEGASALRDIRVHHVLGRPGWFGSTGHGHWVGIGSAQPISIVHELSHSFWGVFPVKGRPELSWELGPSGEVSPGIHALRNDLEQFLAEPPDLYEPLRDRLRRIPDLVTGSPFPGLYHLGEASIVGFTGGNLNLVPPILRKYYGPWLDGGDFANWDEAIAWYLNLNPGDRTLVNSFFPVADLTISGYDRPYTADGILSPEFASVLKNERRQRLVDFVEHYSLLFRDLDGNGAPSTDSRFWRGYITELTSEFERDPSAIAGSNRRERQISASLEFLSALESKSFNQQLAVARSRILSDQFFAPFIPVLTHRLLAELIRDQRDAHQIEAARLVADALAPVHLKFLTATVRLFEMSSSDLGEAQAAFDWFLRSLGKADLRQTNFLLEVMGAIDREAARELLLGLSSDMALSVMTEGAAFTRFLLGPEELIEILGFGGALSPERLTLLAFMFTENISATPSVDEAFQQAIYERIVQLGRVDPQKALNIFIESGLWVEPFLRLRPREALALFDRDLALTARIFQEANPIRMVPARGIYYMLRSDPELAAELTLEYERQGKTDIVEEALVYFAYDAHRKQTQPRLAISLADDARYLLALANRAGTEWLQETIRGAVNSIKQRIDDADAPIDLLPQYRKTLSAAARTLELKDRSIIDTALTALEGVG